MKSGAQKRKEKTQQQIQVSATKFRKLTEIFAAPITPTNNLIETSQFVSLQPSMLI